MKRLEADGGSTAVGHSTARAGTARSDKSRTIASTARRAGTAPPVISAATAHDVPSKTGPTVRATGHVRVTTPTYYATYRAAPYIDADRVRLQPSGVVAPDFIERMAPVGSAERAALDAFFKGKRGERVLIEHPPARGLGTDQRVDGQNSLLCLV